jgi:hypothetical protein
VAVAREAVSERSLSFPSPSTSRGLREAAGGVLLILERRADPARGAAYKPAALEEEAGPQEAVKSGSS